MVGFPLERFIFSEEHLKQNIVKALFQPLSKWEISVQLLWIEHLFGKIQDPTFGSIWVDPTLGIETMEPRSSLSRSMWSDLFTSVIFKVFFCHFSLYLFILYLIVYGNKQ